MAAIPDAPRFAQLTYASFDPGTGAGGWQVKESRGELEPSELRELQAHLVTSFDAHEPLPEYPTPDDIATQPRRCAHLLAHGGPIGAGNGPTGAVTAGCTLHAVQAGSDSTGRPGNVFSHVVLDRDPAAPSPALRPIELWRSFDLLTPYGAEQVLAARLRDGDYPAPSGLVGRDLVLEFVFDPSTWRMGVLSVLLDAVAGALRGGRPVALVASSPDQAAMWIGAVSWCLSPGTARALSWSVYERATRLRRAFERGVHLAAVPFADAATLAELDAGEWIVLDEREQPALGQVDVAPHRTAAGHEVLATAWSQLAQEALVDVAVASRVLAVLDATAADAGDWGLSPAWPLAMAHLETAPAGTDTSMAARVALDEAPARELGGELGATMRRAAVAAMGPSAADAWEMVAAARPGSLASRLAVTAYLRRAIADPAWLARDGGAPAPRLDPEELDGELRDAATASLTGADPEHLLRAADLLARAGVARDESIGAALRDRLAIVVAPRLLTAGLTPGVAAGADGSAEADTAQVAGGGATGDVGAASGADGGRGDGGRGAAELLADIGLADIGLIDIGRLDPLVHRWLVPDALAAALADAAGSGDEPLHHHGEPGRVLRDVAAEWLGAYGPIPSAADAAPPPARAVGDRASGAPMPVDQVSAVASARAAIALDVALALARRSPGAPGVGHALAGALLDRYGSWYGIPAELRRVEPRHLWHAEQLADLERRHPGGLPETFVLPNLACAPPAPDIDRLAASVAGRIGTIEGAVAAMRLDAAAKAGALESTAAPAAASAAAPAPMPAFPHELLSLAGEVWRRFPEHASAVAFGPSVLEAALAAAAADLSDDDWPDDVLEAVRACAAAPGAATLVTERAVRRAAALEAASAVGAPGRSTAPRDGAASTEPDAVLEAAAGALALALVGTGASRRAANAQVLIVAASTDDAGVALPDAVATAIAAAHPRLGESVSRAAAARVAATESDGRHRRVAELERLARKRLAAAARTAERPIVASPSTSTVTSAPPVPALPAAQTPDFAAPNGAPSGEADAAARGERWLRSFRHRPRQEH